MNMSIGSLSKQTGVKVTTIRYYEMIYLLPEGVRDGGNRRRYDQSAVDRLRLIRHARAMGFEIDAIRSLIDVIDKPAGSCREADDIARSHLEDVRRRIRDLQMLEAELARMASGCDDQGVANCRVMSSLTDHTFCGTEHHSNPATLVSRRTQ